MPGGIFDINSKINELSELSIQLQDEKICQKNVLP